MGPMRKAPVWLALALAVSACADSATPTQPAAAPRVSVDSNQNAVNGAATGFTPGWFAGETVQFFYHKNFFCHVPVEDGNPVGSTSGCEIGSDGTEDPRPGNIPVLYVMTPVGFRPDASTLHCPVVGSCINHPATIDVSRVFGPGTENAPLPAHSHIVDQSSGGWWELEVIGVKDLATWNAVVAGKDLATVRALQAADPSATHITDDIPTNLYLFFDVRPGTGNHT